jgi:membrane protein
LWSASAAMVSLIQGVALARVVAGGGGSRDARPGARTDIGGDRVGDALVLLVSAVPPLLSDAGVGNVGRVALDVVRWPLVALIMVSALVVLYHVIGGRSGRLHLGWAPIVGAALAARFGAVRAVHRELPQLQQDLGSLAPIIVVDVWLRLGALSVLIGAEVGAELSG